MKNLSKFAFWFSIGVFVLVLISGAYNLTVIKKLSRMLETSRKDNSALIEHYTGEKND